jgi:hypothetical protein
MFSRSVFTLSEWCLMVPFYGALNSIFSRNSSLAEPVIGCSWCGLFACLPLLVYCLGALELTPSMVQELGVCWNNAFRKIFIYNRWESVKVLQYFCGCLDFTHIYDLLRLRFLSTVAFKLSFLNVFVSSLELQYHRLLCRIFVIVMVLMDDLLRRLYILILNLLLRNIMRCRVECL